MNEEPIVHISIRELRRERSLTQEELAEELGLSRQSINAMEAGRCLPSLPVALQIASFFDVPIALLFRLNNQEQEEEQIGQDNPNNREVNMATLVPWSPLREMRSMLDGLMDESAWSPAHQISVPAVNIHQTEKQVEVEMRLPGFKKDDLSIEVGEDFITISGESKTEEEDGGEGKHFYRREFIQQSFSRAIALPSMVQGDKAKAEMKNGVLHVSIPKMEEEKPKTSKVEIKSVD